MRFIIGVLLFLSLSSSGWSASKQSSLTQPDPKSVRWCGPAYRYPQAGWIVLHIEGKPYDRGFQHGHLMAEEIAGYIRCFAAQLGSKSPSEAWKHTRTLVNAVFLRKFEKEYLEEMQGIADGASAVGAKFDDRKIDLVDIAALNLWAEIETLDSALEATPTGLEGIRFPKQHPKSMPAPPMDHCSAFAATGPSTADGKIVFGHITMFGLYPARFYNIWLDVQPTDGFRVLMQSYPGGIQSGMDYYLNEKGLLVCETTIRQTKFDVEGKTLASRIRKTLQYADNIDKAVEILKEKNNGLYSNEWLLADTKTNEIALFELGTHKTKLMRSSKNEWFANTEGFYWGCNNTKDLEVRLEAIASVEGRPENLVWRPSSRDKAWLRYYEKYKGKISLESAQEAFTTAPLAAYPSLDAKITTTDMAKKMQTYALFGPPLGNIWEPTDTEKTSYPEILPLVPNPWTILHPKKPEKLLIRADDLQPKTDGWLSPNDQITSDNPLTNPSWYGSLLPKGDSEIWLATGFAEYERLFAFEKVHLEQDKKLSSHSRTELALDRFQHRIHWQLQPSVEKGKDPYSQVRDAWVKGETAKGIFFLDRLRQQLGDKSFEESMDAFGRTNPGKKITQEQFFDHIHQSLQGKFDPKVFYREGILPRLEVKVQEAYLDITTDQLCIQGTLLDIAKSGSVLDRVEMTIEHGEEETVQMVPISPDGKFEIKCNQKLKRLVVDKYERFPKENGPKYSVMQFHDDLDHALIVYGSKDHEFAQKAAAELLQQTIRKNWLNVVIPIVSDRQISGQQIKSNHLVLIGSPQTNFLCERFEKEFPVEFGFGSFTVDQEVYAHEGSAVIVSGVNSDNPQRSLVMLAGLSATATYQTTNALINGNLKPGSVLILPHQRHAKSLVLPAKELIVDLRDKPVKKK